MTKPGQEDLLGYLLGALEPDELRRVESALEQNPLLRQKLDELTEELAAIDAIDEPEVPPAGLARRTCEGIANFAKGPSSAKGPSLAKDPSGAKDPSLAMVPSDAKEAAERTGTVQPAVGAFGSVIEARRISRVRETPRTSQRTGAPRSKAAMSAANESGSLANGSWSASELTIAASACLILGLMFFPAIANSRHHARINACQDNLRQISHALVAYSDINGGYLPQPAMSGNLAAAGTYGPILHDQGYISNEKLLLCPSSSLGAERNNFELPSREQIESLRGAEARYWQQRMGGSYAYSMGYIANGKYHPPRLQSRANFVILADAPNLSEIGRRSRNHGGQGQNVVCEDLSIRYLKDCTLCGCDATSGGDQFFVNRNGIVAAGLDSEDSVVGPSEACPLVPYIEPRPQ